MGHPTWRWASRHPSYPGVKGYPTSPGWGWHYAPGVPRGHLPRRWKCVAFPPVNVRQGTSTTSPTLSTSTTSTTKSSYLKSLFTRATTFLKSPKATNSKCTTPQTATTSLIPGTNFLDNYSVNLPTGAPLDAPCDIPDTAKLLPSDNQHDESNLLSEKAILEISQNGNKIQMILNSVLSFTSK